MMIQYSFIDRLAVEQSWLAVERDWILFSRSNGEQNSVPRKHSSPKTIQLSLCICMYSHTSRSMKEQCHFVVGLDRFGSSMLSLCSILLVLLIHTQTVISVHPHPNASKSVKDYHRSMRQTYPTTYINAGLCSDVSYDECLQMEEDMRENARILKDVYSTHGFVRVLVVLVQFPDHVHRQLPTADEYEELFNGEGISDIIPTGSIADWIDHNSYGALKIEAEVMDWVVTDETETYYSFDQSGITRKFRKSMYPALDHLDKQGFDFSRFDLNNDGVIDSLVLLHSGYAAEIGGIACDSKAGTQQRIWSHALSTQNDNWVSPSTGIRASGYSVSSGLRGDCHASIARLSVITHEYMHTLGLPDLNDGSGDWIGRGLGNFDVMSNAHGRDGAQINPAHLCPWSKMQLGWLEPIEITSNGVYQIEASEISNEIYVIRDNFPRGEYLIIENQQPLLWDKLLWGGGLLMWHFDDEQDRLKNRGYPSQSGWPGNGRHYAFALAAADGRYDLEEGNNPGDDGDYWRDGAVFGPGPVESEATEAGTYPNTNSYQRGNIQQTGIVIDRISSSRTTMSFRVTGLAPAPTPYPTTPPPIPIPIATPAPTIPIPIPIATPAPTLPRFTLQPTTLPTLPPTPIATPVTATPTVPRRTKTPSSPSDTTYNPAFLPWSDLLPAIATASPSRTRISNIFIASDPIRTVGAAMRSPTTSDANRMVLSLAALPLLFCAVFAL